MGNKLLRLWGVPANADLMLPQAEPPATRLGQVFLPLVTAESDPVIYYPWHDANPPRTQGYHSSHPAYDYAAPSYTPLYAPFAGRLTYHNESGYAYCLKITNDTWQLQTLLAHMPKDAQTKVGLQSGVMVEAGQLVGYSDNTGYSTGPHIHWEVRRPPYCGYACCLDYWRYTRPWDGQPPQPPPPPDDDLAVGDFVKITGSGVRIRTSPEVKSDNILGSANLGATVGVTAVSDDWVGVTVYISRDWVERVA